MRVVDFVANPERARRGINTWVAQLTRGTIPDLVAPGAIKADTRLALVNALHLKAPWNDPFDPKATQRGPFTLDTGRAVTADLMAADPRVTRHATGPGWQAVSLPYAGAALAMTLVLPDPGRADRLTQTLDGATPRCMITAPQPAGVRLTMALDGTQHRVTTPAADGDGRSDDVRRRRGPDRHDRIAASGGIFSGQ
jgi:serpin B